MASANLYARGASGAPSISSASFVDNLWSRLDSYEDSISATFGFESCTMSLTTSLDEALLIADTWLGNALEVFGDDGDRAWEGQLVTVDLSVAGRTRSVSLDPMQNRQRVRYTTVLGTPGVTATASDATSVALFGTRDGVTSVGTTDATSAASLRAALLADRAYPKSTGATAVSLTAGMGGTGQGVQVTLTFAGWYSTLDWLVLERTDTSTEATTLQIATLLSGTAPGVAATNAFINTTPTITGTGVTHTRKIDADTTYRQAIEQRLSLGNTSNERFAWGVIDNRVFTCATWAGATPTTVTYRVRFGSGEVQNATGAVIPWSSVRPDAILEDADLLAVGTPSGAIDSPDRFYVERVSRRVDASGVSVSFEPPATTGLDARIARIS